MQDESSEAKRRRLGRSAPRSKGGCIKCKRRKVKCDEEKPSCHNCIRLELECEYDYIGESKRQDAKSNGGYQMSVVKNSDREEQDFFKGDWLDMDAAYLSSSILKLKPLEGFHSPNLSDVGFLQFAPLSPNTDFAATDGSISDFASQLLFNPPSPTPSVRSDTSSNNASVKERLLQYFSEAVDPPAVEAINGGWPEIRKTVLKMCQTSAVVAHAVYALAELHSARVQSRKSMVLARTFYDLATDRLRCELINCDTNDEKIWRRLLTAVFLVSCFEIIAVDGNLEFSPKERWADLILRQSKQMKSRQWTYFERRLMTWLVFLDAKVATLGNVSLLEYETACSIDDTIMLNAGDFILSQNESSPRDVIRNAICQPAYNFHLESHKFLRRIQQQDRHSRLRGTPQAESEVNSILKDIAAEMKYLWSRRPAILNQKPEDLSVYVDTTIVTDVYNNLRIYLSQFWAHFIYLHRVAKWAFPIDGDAKDASNKLWGLMNEPGVSDLPGMLWPLFIFVLEAEIAPAYVVIARIRQLDDKIAHANRAADLLQELVRRQDQYKRRITVKSVAMEMFGNVFPII